MKRIKHWQDPVSVLMGLWLVASPWVLGITGPLQAIGDFVFIGTMLVAFAVSEMFVPEDWEEWSELVMGLWLMASPWILEFNGVARQNAVICGLVVTALAAWVLVSDAGYIRRLHRHHPG